MNETRYRRRSYSVCPLLGQGGRIWVSIGNEQVVVFGPTDEFTSVNAMRRDFVGRKLGHGHGGGTRINTEVLLVSVLRRSMNVMLICRRY